MKKLSKTIVSTLLSLSIAVSMCFPVIAMESPNTDQVMMMKLNETKTYLNGVVFDNPVYDNDFTVMLIMVLGSSLLPMRFVCESLGMTVDYDYVTGNSFVESGDIRIEIVTGTNTMIKTVNGGPPQIITASAPAILIGGYTHVPVRSLLQELGYSIFWHEEGYLLIAEDPNTFYDFEDIIEFYNNNID